MSAVTGTGAHEWQRKALWIGYGYWIWVLDVLSLDFDAILAVSEAVPLYSIFRMSVSSFAMHSECNGIVRTIAQRLTAISFCLSVGHWRVDCVRSYVCLMMKLRTSTWCSLNCNVDQSMRARPSLVRAIEEIMNMHVLLSGTFVGNFQTASAMIVMSTDLPPFWRMRKRGRRNT